MSELDVVHQLGAPTREEAAAKGEAPRPEVDADVAETVAAQTSESGKNDERPLEEEAPSGVSVGSTNEYGDRVGGALLEGMTIAEAGVPIDAAAGYVEQIEPLHPRLGLLERAYFVALGVYLVATAIESVVGAATDRAIMRYLERLDDAA